jgi:O-succinylbenzoic acid--CoA ligase
VKINNLFEQLLRAQNKPHLFYNPKLKFSYQRLKKYIEEDFSEKEAFLFPTSGSSGTYKWIYHTQESLLCSAKGVVDFLQLSEDDRQLVVLPTFHVGGFSQWVRASVARMETLPFQDTWCVDEFIRVVKKNAVSVTSLVPTQLFDLVECERVAPDSLRVVLLGGARLSPSLYERAKALGWPVLPSYGMTEAASTIACAPLSSLESKTYPDLELLSHWSEVSLGRNCGRLKLKGRALMSGVLSVDALAANFNFESIPENSTYKTGDLVSFDKNPDGKIQLSFIGRHDRRIKVLGEWVNLDDIEQKIRSTIKENALALEEISWELVTRSDSRRGIRLLLLIEKLSMSVGAAQAFLKSVNEGLNSLELIEDIHFVDQIPRSPLGKFLPSELEMNFADN